MINWFEKLRCVVENGSTVILVTVTAVRGSAPREIGAKILITETQQWGTVGGGNLEFKAIAQARELLRNRRLEATTAPAIHAFALGPTLGQCCGGHVELMFERIDCDTGWFRQAVEITTANINRRLWVCRSLIDPGVYRFIEHGHGESDNKQFPSVQNLAGSEARVLYPEAVSTAGSNSSIEAAGTSAQELSAGWWCEVLNPELPEVWVFGAGHVGRALHEQLQLLPCNAVAIDCREDLLGGLPSSVRIISTDCCVSEVESAPSGVWFIVVTHSHALDFDLCCAVLKRTDFAYLGLIGSTTKRATFAKRLAHRGIASTQIDCLISPIGLTTIKSRLPQLIALGVATDLAHQWQDISI